VVSGGAETVVRVGPDAVLRRTAASWALVDGRVVARSAGTSLAVALDPVSSVVWRCLDGVSTLAEVVADVAEAFAVPAEHAIDELVPVVESWRAEGLVADSVSGADEREREHGRRWRRLLDPPNA
jgi:hypothetical protein